MRVTRLGRLELLTLVGRWITVKRLEVFTKQPTSLNYSGSPLPLPPPLILNSLICSIWLFPNANAEIIVPLPVTSV